MKSKIRPKEIQYQKFAWYPMWCEDIGRWVWLEHVWVEKELYVYMSGYRVNIYYYARRPEK